MRVSVPLVMMSLLCFAQRGPVLAGEGTSFVMSSGVEVATPPIEALECAAMIDLMAKIDATGYRRGAASPANPDDLAMLIYENRLARRFYAECVRAPGNSPDATSAFRSGYDGDRGPDGND